MSLFPDSKPSFMDLEASTDVPAPAFLHPRPRALLSGDTWLSPLRPTARFGQMNSNSSNRKVRDPNPATKVKVTPERREWRLLMRSDRKLLRVHLKRKISADTASSHVGGETPGASSSLGHTCHVYTEWLHQHPVLQTLRVTVPWTQKGSG